MTISKRNKRGVWVLILVCISLAYVPRVIAGWNQTPISVSYNAIDAAEQKIDRQQERGIQKEKKALPKEKEGILCACQSIRSK